MLISVSSIFNFGALHCILLAAIVFMLPLRKRSMFSLRLTLGLLIFLLPAAILPGIRILCVKYFHGITVFGLPAAFFLLTFADVLPFLLLSFGLILFCCNLKPGIAMYIATLAYLTQAVAYSIFVFLFPEYAHRSSGLISLAGFWRELLIITMVYPTVYFFFARKLPRNGIYEFRCGSSLLFLLLFILVCRYFGIISTRLFKSQSTYLFKFLLIHDLILYVVLFMTQILLHNSSKLQADLEVQQHVQKLQQREYLVFLENSQALNHKFHDLRLLLRSLQLESDSATGRAALQEMEHRIAIHDCAMNTGNEVLDAILSEIWIRCEHKEIQWTCMADGSALSFLSPSDLYIMLGNALNNAIDAAEQATDKNQRYVSVNIRKENQFAYIRIENYCPVIPEFSNGLPLTTKNDKFYHGYGAQSIQTICQKYHGECRMSAQNHIFTTKLLLPIPQSKPDQNHG